MKTLLKTLLPGLALLACAANGNAGELKPVDPPRAAPTLQLKDLQGRMHDLSAYRGKVVMVNFWATWCPPCRAEMPSMQRLKEKLAGKPFAILAVNMAESEHEVRQFLRGIKGSKIDFTILMDKDGKASKQWKVFVFPTTFIVDAEGKLRYALLGGTEWDDARNLKAIEALLPAGQAVKALAP